MEAKGTLKNDAAAFRILSLAWSFVIGRSASMTLVRARSSFMASSVDSSERVEISSAFPGSNTNGSTICLSWTYLKHFTREVGEFRPIFRCEKVLNPIEDQICNLKSASGRSCWGWWAYRGMGRGDDLFMSRGGVSRGG